MFQSLLYWIVGRDDAYPMLRVVLSGFNPCCIGLWVATEVLGDDTHAALRFQSLLYWIVGRDTPWTWEVVTA